MLRVDRVLHVVGWTNNKYSLSFSIMQINQGLNAYSQIFTRLVEPSIVARGDHGVICPSKISDGHFSIKHETQVPSEINSFAYTCTLYFMYWGFL